PPPTAWAPEPPKLLYRFAEADDRLGGSAPLTVGRPQPDRSLETAAYLARNRNFESISLHRGVRLFTKLKGCRRAPHAFSAVVGQTLAGQIRKEPPRPARGQACRESIMVVLIRTAFLIFAVLILPALSAEQPAPTISRLETGMHTAPIRAAAAGQL